MLKRGCFIDVSERAIVSLVGTESLDLLQRISTNDVAKLDAGRTVHTVLTNEKGRIVEVLSVLDRGGQGLLVVGQGKDSTMVKQWIEKYVIMENITVMELSAEFIHLMVYDSTQSMEDLIRPLALTGCRVFGETLASVQLTHVLAAKESSGAVIKWLLEADFVQSAEQDYEEYRVLRGIPGYPHELSTSYNPLEAGLLPLVSFTKGCYIGQEVVARLDTYKKVQRGLVRLKMSELPVKLPEKIYSTGQEWGSITSAVRLRDSHECRGLGYMKTGSETSINGLYFHKGGNEIKLVIDSQGTKPT